MSCILLGLAAIYTDSIIHYSIAVIGLVLLTTSVGLFIYAMFKFVLAFAVMVPAENRTIPPRPATKARTLKSR